MIYHFKRVYPYYTSLCIYTHMYVCVYVCVCVCACVCLGVHVCVCCACMYIMYAICVCVCVRVCARVCSYMMYMRLSVGHTRTHTHTHTCTTAPQIWVTSFAEKGTSPKQRKMDKQVCPPHYPHPPPLPPRSLPKRCKATSLAYVLFFFFSVAFSRTPRTNTRTSRTREIGDKTIPNAQSVLVPITGLSCSALLSGTKTASQILIVAMF